MFLISYFEAEIAEYFSDYFDTQISLDLYLKY